MVKAQAQDILNYTEAKGGTEDELDKVIIIDGIYRKLNGREQA